MIFEPVHRFLDVATLSCDVLGISVVEPVPLVAQPDALGYRDALLVGEVEERFLALSHGDGVDAPCPETVAATGGEHIEPLVAAGAADDELTAISQQRVAPLVIALDRDDRALFSVAGMLGCRTGCRSQPADADE